MARILGGKIEQTGLHHLFLMKYYGNNRLPDVMGNHHIESGHISNIKSQVTGTKGYLRLNQSGIEFKNITDTSFSIMMSFKVSDINTTQTLISQYNFLKVYIEDGFLKCRVTKSGEVSVHRVQKKINGLKWHTFKITISDGDAMYLWLDTVKLPAVDSLSYSLSSSGMCYFGKFVDSNNNESEYFDGDISNIAYYNIADFAKPETFKFYSVTINKQLKQVSDVIIDPEVEVPTITPQDTNGLVLAYTTESFTLGDTTLYNVAGVNTHLSMSVFGNPTIEDGSIKFESGDYAVGSYDDFIQILPNQSMNTHTGSYTLLGLFSSLDNNSRGSIFDLGYKPSTRIGQYAAAGPFHTRLGGRNDNSFNFSERGSHHQFVGNGIDIDYDEATNLWVGHVGMLGHTVEYRDTTSDYVVSEILDGKFIPSWNPPPHTVEGSVITGSISWDWYTSGWAKRAPVINAVSTTGTPTGLDGLYFRGLYIYNRVLSESEIENIYNYHNG